MKRIILEFQEDMYKVIKMEIMPEHIHLLIDCNPYKSPVDIVKHIKHQSALQLKKTISSEIS